MSSNKTGTAGDVVKAWSGERQCEDAPEDRGQMPAERVELEYFQKTLQQNDGKVAVTARSPGMYRLTLREKLARQPVAE